MAQEHKNTKSPNVELPHALTLCMRGFTDSEQEATAYFEQAIKSIAGNSKITKQELKNGYTLFRTLNPLDDYEKIWCAQFIISHLLGMHNISLASPRDKRIGIKLLKAAEDAMERIYNKRNMS